MNINIETSYDKVVNSFNKKQLSLELDNYIINNCHFISLNKNITLNIKGINKNKQKEIQNIIHKHYENKYNITKSFDDIDNYIRLILFIIGVIAIYISKKLTFIFSEIFLIAGWVIIWEIIYDILFNDLKRKRKAKIYKKLATANIIFNEEE